MTKRVIYNEDCFKTIEKFKQSNTTVDIILTSPPYNTGKGVRTQHSIDHLDGRYDIYLDTKTQSEYRAWCVDLFNNFDDILSTNGVVLWNASYGTNNTNNKEGIGTVWLTIADIIQQTSFIVADRIIWKKKNALPNNTSSNKLTRIVEDIFVFCRKAEYKTFQCNKAVTSVSHRGQNFYENVFNFIEAPNNDGTCKLNKATFSSDLCIQLLNIYAKQDSVVYDPFMGSGTTAVACRKLNLNCYGSELSRNQCLFAMDRLKNTKIEKKGN